MKFDTSRFFALLEMPVNSRRRRKIFELLLACFCLVSIIPYFYYAAPNGIPRHSITEHSTKAQNMQELKYSYIDDRGQIIIDAAKYQRARSFSEGLAAVYLEGHGWGFIDKSGKVTIEPQYQAALDFSEELAGIQADNKFGFIDKAGAIVIEPQYDWVNDFSEGIAVVKKGENLILIDKKGDAILSRPTTVLDLSIYENNARFSDGLIHAYDRKEARWGYMDRTGNFVIQPIYTNAAPFSEGLARVEVIKDGEEKIGFIDRSGRFAISPIFNSDGDFHRNSTDFSDGLASLTEGLAPTVTDEAKFVYIDKSGAIVHSTGFFNASSFRNGMAAVYDEEMDKWGYINKSGKIVIPLQYASATDFSDGLACVAIRNRSDTDAF